jgi:hypothetical protein
LASGHRVELLCSCGTPAEVPLCYRFGYSSNAYSEERSQGLCRGQASFFDGYYPLAWVWYTFKASYPKLYRYKGLVIDIGDVLLNREKYAPWGTAALTPRLLFPHEFMPEQIQYTFFFQRNLAKDLPDLYQHHFQTENKMSRLWSEVKPRQINGAKEGFYLLLTAEDGTPLWIPRDQGQFVAITVPYSFFYSPSLSYLPNRSFPVYQFVYDTKEMEYELTRLQAYQEKMAAIARDKSLIHLLLLNQLLTVKCATHMMVQSIKSTMAQSMKNETLTLEEIERRAKQEREAKGYRPHIHAYLNIKKSLDLGYAKGAFSDEQLLPYKVMHGADDAVWKYYLDHEQQLIAECIHEEKDEKIPSPIGLNLVIPSIEAFKNYSGDSKIKGENNAREYLLAQREMEKAQRLAWAMVALGYTDAASIDTILAHHKWMFNPAIMHQD